MKKFYLKPLVAAIALTAAGQGYAQDEAGTEVNNLEEVVVTGFRASLANALNTKRESVGSVDAIFAEDIADFPDTNLAESLQRIPGVAITRDGGEGRSVSVRGLGAQFTRVRINGMEAMATTGASDAGGGANRGRGFDFNTFASELFQGLAVQKTASANLEEGSLGATIDLSTAKPLEFQDSFTLRAGVKGTSNSISDGIDPRLTVLVAGKNEAESIGWSLSLATSSKDRLETGNSTVRWRAERDFASCSACADEDEFAQVNAAVYPRIPRVDRYEHKQDRTGITASLQLEPSDTTEILVDYLYSKTESTRREEFLELGIKESYNAPNADVTSFTLANGTHDDMLILTQLGLDNVTPRIENRFDELNTDFNQFSVRLNHEFSDRLRMKAAAGTSTSDFSNPVQTTIILDAPGTNGYSYDYGSPSGRNPVIDYGSLDVTSPDQWLFTNVRDRPNSVKNQFDTVESSLEFDFNESFGLEAGFNYKQFQYNVDEGRRDSKVEDIDGFDSPIPVTADMINMTSVDGVEFISPDIGVTSEMVGLYQLEAKDTKNVHQQVNEDGLGLFVQANWELDIADMPFRGNVGVRHVTTDLLSEGVAALSDGSQEFVSVSREYSNTLPSLNTSLELTNDLILRFSWSEVMTRPSLSSLTPGGKVDTFNAKIDVKNPYLDPFLAKATDVSIEWYFAEDALLSLAYFQKDISSFIASQTITQKYSDTGYSTDLLEGSGYTPDDDFSVKTSYNSDGGTLNGYEIIYQQPFTFLPGIFSDFGVQANMTHVTSELEYSDGIVRPLNGQSENTFSGTFYYENDALSARISMVNRGDYYTDADGRDGLDEIGVKATSFVDLSVSYAINDNFDISLEGNNLTNEVYDQYVDSANMVYTYHETGTNWTLGAQYKF